MENTQKKKLKDKNQNEIRKYKREKERERWRNLDGEIKGKIILQKKENMKKSRNSRTLEEAKFQRIVDRQRKRNGKKSDISENGKMCNKDLLEWIGFFQESEDNRALLKIKNNELYSTCKAYLAGKNSDIEIAEETKLVVQTQQDKERCKKELRERIAKFREKQGPEIKELNRIKAKLGMAKLRSQEAQHDRDIDKEELKDRMAELRKRQTPEEKEMAREEARIGMIESRRNKVEEIKEYQRIKEKYKKRESIRLMSKEILSDRKEKGKQGMRLLRKEGRLRKEKQRTQRNMDMLTEFGEYLAKS